MSTAPIRMTTRSANATAHPGLVVAAAKRTREDGKTKKELAKEKKQAKEEKKKVTIRTVASLEKRMAEADDAFDVTPKPQGTSKRQLQRTRSYAQLPLTFESSNNSGSEAAGKDVHDGTETEHNTTEEEAPPKKKVKPGFRDTVQMHLDREVNVSKSKDRRQRTDYVEIADSQDEDDELYEATPVAAAAIKKPPVAPKPAGNRRQKSSASNGRDDSDADSVVIVETKVGAKGKGGRTNTASDRKGRKGPTDKPNRDLDEKDKHSGLIKDWATKIPRNAKPESTRTPSLTHGSTRSSHAASSIRSALNAVKISNHDDGVEIAEGGLSDFDETIGNERDAAIKSPPKGKQRISSTALVKVEDSPKPIILQTKRRAKPTNNKLPKEWLEDGVWRKRIIPSVFRWAGIQENTWVISDEHITDALTKICEAHFGDLTESITPNSEPIRVVSQRLSEWRSSFGSAAIAIVNAFFDDNDDYRDSDMMRQEFATHMLDKLRFTYRHNRGDDKKKFRGLFRNPLVVQTFAVHFNAISGSRWVEGLYEEDKPPKPLGVLGMAAAAVERALMLWSTGGLTIEIIQEARDTKKAIKLPVMINPVTGKQSARYSAFSVISWNKPTQGFVKSIKNLTDDAMEAIVNEAKEFARASRYRDEGNDEVDPDDERANLVDGSDGTLSDPAMSEEI